ncbi:MAG: T9SS type A sorting domain-containing protein [Ignavibacteria bacterium]|nr:T9SS type A sorting domain-containing protein [Ignavibacteria bacterium]
MNYLFTKLRIDNLIKSVVFLIIVFLISPNLIFSQTNQQKKHNPPDPSQHHEVKDDDYIPDLRESQGRSPAYTYLMSNITTHQVNVDLNGQNIVGDAANEPSIAVDPTDHNRIAIGWRQFNTINSNFRQAGWGFTTNGGQTWTFPGVIEPGIFRSDPVLDADKDGNFYYNSLTNSPTYLCDVFKSSDGGSSWDGGTFAQGGDKQWMTIDKTDGPGTGHNYSFWTSSYSVCSPGFFTRSTDGGGSFEDCITIPNDPYWGTLTVGSNGELYVGGSIGFDFQVAKSTNAQISGQTIIWDMNTVVDLDGSITIGIGPNPGGLGGQTSIAVDTSGGPYHGNVYLLCSVDRDSNSDPSDVMFARSTNGGANWSSPIKINDDPGISAYQWFGTMSVAPTGRIDVIWLDTRDNPGTNISALYYSNSMDGGTTWSTNERLSDYFDPHVGWPQQQKMGDYFHMVSDNNGANLAWAATFNGEQDVYYSYIADTTIVPVELLSFSASVAANVVTLSWSTVTELNNHGFEIERSSDKSNLPDGEAGWRVIGFKVGKGTTSEQQQYTYSDILSDVESFKLYYRLKQVDFNGSFEYSNIIEVEIAPSVFSLSQNYPNPFNPATIIKYQLPINNFVSINLYDVLGNEVATLVNEEKPAGSYEVEFNASEMGSGVYFYTLRAGEFVQSKKMLLLK